LTYDQTICVPGAAHLRHPVNAYWSGSCSKLGISTSRTHTSSAALVFNSAQCIGFNSIPFFQADGKADFSNQAFKRFIPSSMETSAV
jgi:hypothetical protein